jgi:glutaredoxin
MTNLATVTIYTRPGCHLCDEAKSSIRAAGCDDQFTLEEVSSLDPTLLERYGDIPVVFINGTKVFKHRLNPRDFKRKLHRLTKASRLCPTSATPRPRLCAASGLGAFVARRERLNPLIPDWRRGPAVATRVPVLESAFIFFIVRE